MQSSFTGLQEVIKSDNKVINTKEGRKELYNRFNLDDQLFTIGVFSRIEEQKGQHLVVEALNSINNNCFLYYF